MWSAAQEIARRDKTSVDEICTMVSSQQTESSLTSSMRVYILNYFWDLAGRLEPEVAERNYEPV